MDKDKLEVIHDWVNELKSKVHEEWEYDHEEEGFVPELLAELSELDEYIEKHKEGIRSGI